MLRNLLVKSDGTEIDSAAIFSCTCIEQVNDGDELTIGSTCCDELTVEYIVDVDNTNLIAQGDALTYYRVDENGEKVRTVGVFYCEKPEYQSVMRGNNGELNLVFKVTAYDGVSKLECDFTQWLVDNQDKFPLTISEIVKYACEVAGVELANDLPINGDYSVSAFSISDLTCRQIISWAAGAGACFAHMNSDGELQFRWYTDKREYYGIAPTSNDGKDKLQDSTSAYVNDSAGVQIYVRNNEGLIKSYWGDGLTYEDYDVAKIQKVQIKQSADDVGVVYPDDESAVNTYVIASNYLLVTQTESTLKGVAQNILTALQDVTYKPCNVSIPDESCDIVVGDIITVKNALDETFPMYVMTATTGSGNVDFECEGSASRDSVSAVNSQTYKNVTGKLLELKTSVDGFNVKASQLSNSVDGLTEQFSEFKVDVDGILGQVVTEGNVRSKFAMDSESVTISSGVITFSGNSLVVNSDNFKLAQDGTVNITGTFTSEGNGNKAYIGNGEITLSKTINGSTYNTVKLYSVGSGTAAMGHIDVYGEAQSLRATMWTDQGGGYVQLYTASGVQIFEAKADGDGEGHVSIGGVNGLGYLECKRLKVDGHRVSLQKVYYTNQEGDATWEWLLTAHQGDSW